MKNYIPAIGRTISLLRRTDMRNKDYPLYETTVFEDFRIMTENVADRHPDRTAFSYKKKPTDKEVVRVTFAQAREYIRNLGTGLIAMGYSDKHVALIGESSFEWVCSYFALMSIGSVVVPIDKEIPASDMIDILDAADCEYIVMSPSIAAKTETFSEKVSAIKEYVSFGESNLPGAVLIKDVVKKGEELFLKGDRSYYEYKIDTDRLATIVYTSGTTGKGKGVMLSQKNIVLDMTNGMYFFTLTPRTINFLPPHHTFGSTVNFVGHFAQGVEVYLSSGLRYIAQEIKEQRPTHLILVPLFLEKLNARIWAKAEETGKDKLLRRMMKISNALRKVGIDLRRKLFKSVLEGFGGELELVICGGAALKQDLIDTFDAIGVTVLNGYGITECAPLVSCNRNRYRKEGSVGKPIKDEIIKIREPNENGEGEICVKGPNVMLGYYKDPEATAEAFDPDGFFMTGDFGRLDEEGWLYITGRLKNLIILSNGKNVYPEEIELMISQIRGVEEVVVYAGESRSQKDKETIVAEIFPNRDILAADGVTDVRAYFDGKIKEMNKGLVSYRAVGQVKLRDEEFEKNTSKKIVRFRIDKSVE